MMCDVRAAAAHQAVQAAGPMWRKERSGFRHIVSGIGVVAEIEAQMFSLAQKFNRGTELEFSTSAAITPIPSLLYIHKINTFKINKTEVN